MHKVTLPITSHAPVVSPPAELLPAKNPPEKSPYSSEFLVQFCREHWASWISQVQRTLTRVQQDHLEAPSFQLESTMYGLEQLLHPLLKVSILILNTAHLANRHLYIVDFLVGKTISKRQVEHV